MQTDKDSPLALPAYEALADAYNAMAETKPHNAYYDRPAVLSLLPNLAGKRLLDAGCGPGIYLEAMIALGAKDPVGVDVSPRMLTHAKTRLRDKATLHELDLNLGLPQFADGSFDVIVSPLVLDYLPDWKRIFSEFFRLLTNKGIFIFSVEHPSSDYRTRTRENYFEIAKTELVWRGFHAPVLMPSYRRPLAEMINPLIQSGFTLVEILEPKPTTEFRQADEKEFAHLSTTPGFICFKAQKLCV